MTSSAKIQSSGLLLLIAYLGFVSLGLPDAVAGVAWPSVRATFSLSQGSFGAVFIGAGCGYFLSSFLIGRVLSRVAIGVLLAASSALVAASVLGYAMAPQYAFFVGAALFHGLGSGAIDAGLNHYAAHHFSARHMNWLHASYSLGATLGPLLMLGVLTRSGSWRMGYAAVGAAMLGLSVLFALSRRRWNPAPDSVPAPKQTQAAPGIAHTLGLPGVRLQMALFFVYTGLEVTVGQWGFTLLSEARGISAPTAGLWITLYWGSIGVGRVFFGFVVERIGIDRLLRVSIALAVGGALLLAARVAPMAALALIGLGLAPVYPCLMTRTPQRLGPQCALHAIGFQVAAAMVGAALLPALCGLLAQAWGLEKIAAFALALALSMGALHECLLRLPGDDKVTG